MRNQKIIIILVVIGVLLISIIFSFHLLNLLKQKKYTNFDYLSCDSDNDCTTTKFSINGCCIECDIFPINRQGLKLQEEWRKENCASKDYTPCTTFKCLWPDKNVSCVQNKCVFDEENNAGFKNGQFSLRCFNECSSQDKSLILSTAQKTLEVLQKEFPWMVEPALKAHYIIEVNPMDASAGGRSYVDYETRTVKLVRIDASTVAHEISHLLTAEYFGVEKIRPPLSENIFPKGPAWFQEGLAMYLEYKVDNSRNAKNITLLKNTSNFLDITNPESSGDTNLWYAYAWGVVDYIIQRDGKERFRILCECVKQKLPPVIGEPLWSECFDNAYKSTTLNWESFYEEWVAYAKQIY